MALYAIGDVHGCPRTLEALLDRLSLTEDDEVVFVGDYIDRGPDSMAVVERLLALRETHRCRFLRGNHEAFLLDYLAGRGADLWMMNGGVETLASYRAAGCEGIPDAHRAFYEATELYYDAGDFFFVHAGLDPSLSIADNLAHRGENTFLWERNHLYAADLPWEKPVICGHTPQPEPLERERLLVIDTGCVYYDRPGYGRLTAVQLPERRFISVEYQG